MLLRGRPSDIEKIKSSRRSGSWRGRLRRRESKKKLIDRESMKGFKDTLTWATRVESDRERLNMLRKEASR